MESFEVLRVLAAVGAAVIAGVFFAFSSFVMSALARAGTERGMVSMQAINVTVINWHFLGLFFGVGVLALVVLWRAVAIERSVALVAAGAALYLLGTVLVTIVCNVPRNEALAKRCANDADSDDVWRRYVVEWTRWNTVRTVAAAAAAVCFSIA